MGQSDWTFCSDGLSTGSVDRGVTTGITRPNGGGSFLFGFNSLEVVAGAIALFNNQTNFAPNASGGSVRGAVKRGVSGGKIGFSPFLMIGLQGPSVLDNAYLLGLSDDDPHRIALRKGAVVEGIPADAIGSGGILEVSTETFENDTWLHLRLDMIVNLNGDVILKAFASDLDSNPVTAPIWEAIPGLDDFVDDALGINSGSPPFTTSRFGFGFEVSDVTRRAFVDHVEVFRQI